MNLIYFGEFRDINNTLWRINIYKEGFIGNAEELTLADNPVIINYEGDNDIYKPIKYSQCTIKVLTPKVLDIYSSKVFDVKIQVLKNNVEYWNGWNTPTVYSSEYYSDLDEVEINAIDTLAATKYVDYDNYYKRGKCYVERTQIYTDFSSSMTGTHIPIYQETWGYDTANPNLGEFRLTHLYVYGDGVLRFEFTYNLGTVVTESYDVNFVGDVTINGIPYLGGTINYEWDGDNIIFEPVGHLTEISSNYLQISQTDEGVMGEHSLLNIVKNCLEIANVTNYNIYYVNDISIEDLSVSEYAFYDEDGEPAKVSEILENICQFLGVQMCQLSTDYYLVDINKYAYADVRPECTTYIYSSNGDTSTYSGDYSIKSLQIAENTSNLSLNEVYNQVSVVSKNTYNPVVIYENAPDNDFSNYITVTTSDGYEHFYKSESSMETLNILNPQSQMSYKLDEVYPHPDLESYIVYRQYSTADKPAIKAHLRSLAEGGLSAQDLFFSKTFDYTISKHTNSLYLVIDFECMISDEYTHCLIDPESNKESLGVHNGTQGYPIFDAVLNIGNQYWDGTTWSDTPTSFKIEVGENNEGFTKDNWYSVCDTTNFRYQLDNSGYSVDIPPTVNGIITLSIYRGTPYSIRYYDNILQQWVYSTWTSIVNDPDTFFDAMPDYWDYFECPNYFFRDNIKFKNINITLNQSVLKFKAEKDDEDCVYSQVIDDNNVTEHDDIDLILSTYNESFSNHIADNNVFNSNTLLKNVEKDGYVIRPEQHIIRRYCDYYSNPRKIYQNTFKLDDYKPIDAVIVPYMDNQRFIIGSVEDNLKYQTSNLTLYEI